MAKMIDLTGKIFGRWTVVSVAYRNHDGYSWNCVCSCGNARIVRGNSLRAVESKSCGCAPRSPRIKLLPYGHSSRNAVIASYRVGARSRNLEWKLSIEECLNLFENLCFYCDSPPSNEKTQSTLYIYNGIDRVDNTKGYVIDNVVTCCSFCNSAKSDYSQEEFLLYVKKIYEKHNLGIK